jgi:regulator of sigma E protease
MAWLSISLGVINLFPIPILDGGHLFFFAIEAVTRREVPIKVRQVAAYFGLACILALMVTVFWNDIARNWGTISNWF